MGVGAGSVVLDEGGHQWHAAFERGASSDPAWVQSTVRLQAAAQANTNPRNTLWGKPKPPSEGSVPACMHRYC